MRNGLVTPREESCAKQMQVMLLGGWCANDVVSRPIEIGVIGGVTQALLVEKHASNLSSDFLQT